MNNSNEQNGAQPSTSSTEQAAPPTDPRTRNAPHTPESQRICRDFVWGICLLNEQCRYRHELSYESMRAILKFCHDYQNRTGCLRPDCTYLHTSREEENAFLQTGQIPRVLADRYTSMSMTIQGIPGAPAVPSENGFNMNIGQPPPPPPPPNTNGPPPPPPVAAPVPPPVPTAAIPGQSAMSASSQMATVMVSPLPTMLVPPPPPPPPPPPTVTTVPTPMTGPTYTQGLLTVSPHVHQNISAVYPVPSTSQQQQPIPQQQQPIPQPQPSSVSIPVVFDPSKPPPPIPSQSRTVKRPAEEGEAGPSKARKSEGSNDSFCENCIQREIRSQLYRQESERLQREAEYHQLLQERTQEEINNGKTLLRSLLRPEVYRILDNVFDGDEPIPSSVSDLYSPSSSPTYSSNHSTVPRQLIIQLLESLLNPSNNDHLPSLPSIENISRRTPNEADLVATVLELIRNSNLTTENRVTTVETINTNGLSRFTNGMDNSSPPNVGSRYGSSLGVMPTTAALPAMLTIPAMPTMSNISSMPAMSNMSTMPVMTTLPSMSTMPAMTTIPSMSTMPAMSSMPSTSSPRYQPPSAAQPPRPYASSIEPPAPPPPVPSPYMSYPATVPPPAPTRPYYQPYPATFNNVAYNPPMQQGPRASSSTSAPSPGTGQSYAPYMTRMPHQYYPPFQ